MAGVDADPRPSATSLRHQLHYQKVPIADKQSLVACRFQASFGDSRLTTPLPHVAEFCHPGPVTPLSSYSTLESCSGIGMTGTPRIPRESHGVETGAAAGLPRRRRRNAEM